jgi:hypothetical protein
MKTDILEGKTFNDWEYEVEDILLKDGFNGISRCKDFIKRVAAFTWEGVEDGCYDKLRSSFDDFYPRIEDEYHIYRMEQAQVGIDDICYLLSNDVDDGYDILCSILNNLKKHGILTYNQDKLDKLFDDPSY